MKTTDDDIRKIEELEDGSSVYEIGTPPETEDKDTSFYDNLAVKFPEEARKKLSTLLLDSIKQDIEARQDWMDSVEKVKKYLGFSLEDLDAAPYKGATRTFDTTLSTALIRFYATTRAELLPGSGPAGFKITGVSSEEIEKKGEANRDWLNYYLTVQDESYYSDFERFLLYLGLYGSGFKKVYYDQLLKKPLSRFIRPEDFVIDGDCTSILESSRLTHILHLSKRDIILNQQNKIYRDAELSYLKTSENPEDEEKGPKKDDVDISVYTKQSLFPIYEVHTYLNLKDFTDDSGGDETDNAIPLPYIVTIDKITKEILSIRKNWEENDPEQKRENYFVQYNYLPGFGVYGIGLAHLIGSNAITLTKLLRQLVDAGSFKNLPGGLRSKGFKSQNNDLIVGPGQFVEVDTGGIPLGEAFMPLPYSEPSAALRELRLEIVAQCKELGSTSEMGMLQSKEDIPTGTTIALLETNNRIQSSVLRSVHVSLTRELQLIDKLFRKTLESEEFNFGNSQRTITANDFLEEVKIIPVSDPSVNSTTQKILKAESILRTAQQAPELHNMREVLRQNYEAQGLDAQDIDNILKPEPQEAEVLPLDPISENLNAMKDIPLKAAIWQDHAAHKLTHGLFAQTHPEFQPIIMAHVKEHEAFEYLIQMQQLLGQELPPLEEIQDPQIQNSIAMAIAGALEDSDIGGNQQEAPIDPNALLMADIQQKQAEIEAKERIASQKTETDIFKAQLDFEKEKAKIESAEDIAKLKTETDILKAELDFEREKAKIESVEDMAELKSQTELIKQGVQNDGNY
ncbi:MAG: hypothetical protein RL662_1785 [Bacteroidota bacterium]|jgi:hypothetical protein